MTSPLKSRPKLFRYSEHRWLVRSLMLGEFRISPASYYGELVGDSARHDDELVRETDVPGDRVTITNLTRGGAPIRPIGDVVYRDEVGTNYFTLSFSTAWDVLLFDEFNGSNACLILHEPEEVCSRIHFHADHLLHDWAGFDCAVSYGADHPCGPAFIKHWKYLAQKEWRFAWLPPKRCDRLTPFFVRIGNIERFAEIVPRPKE